MPGWIKELQHFRVIIYASLLIVVAFLGVRFLNPDRVDAAQLLGASDFITDDTPDALGVEHNISFVIPSSGDDIDIGDYVIINFPNHTDITVPSSSSGWSGGSPIYSISGNRILITNVSAENGMAIGIGGILATNPPSGQPTEISVQIGDDTVPTTQYHAATITPQALKGITTASVIVTTEISSLDFSGYTSPNAFVTIFINGAVAGTTTANSSGNFNKIITGLEPNYPYNVSVIAEDTKGRTSNKVEFIAMTMSGVYVSISHIAIPTTLQGSHSVIYQGDSTLIEGLAHPYSQITLFVKGTKNYTYVITADGAGKWSYNLNTREYPLDPGTHQIYAKEAVTGGYTSIYTREEELIVKECKPADINCDTHVDLTDFSIMMYFWQLRFPANERSDINRDTYVNLTDFSLLLYHWTG